MQVFGSYRLKNRHPHRSKGLGNDGLPRTFAGCFFEKRFVKGIFLIRERPAQNHDRALSK
jgi:hypothetical protein